MSDAGVRTVPILAIVLPDLSTHVAEHVGDKPAAFVFLGELGGLLRRSNFRRATKWPTTAQAVGLPSDFHFRD